MYASQIGSESIGISFNEKEIQKARFLANMLRMPNVRFLQHDLRCLDRLADKLGKFDQIILFETIEHVQNDEKLISDLSILLKPGGRLLLTTPFKNCRPLFGDKLSQYEGGGHVRWGYTHEEIGQLLNKYGIAVLTEEYISGIISQKLCDVMRRWSKMDDRTAWAATFPLRLFQFFDSTLTGLIRYPYFSIGVVGVKHEDKGRFKKVY
jgi:2-polyprenyl-3-methyl-5-hydroxy-6-metoxy-1,4-benzoquinol methylase